MSLTKPGIIVHGGAFNIPESYVERYRSGTKTAAQTGYQVLSDGGSAVDAVEAAVKYLEDNPAFNAGHGSVLTEAGTVEMDAIIVDGKSNSSGGVACVRDIANPVSLARKVMNNTCHCLLCGEGAMKFAKDIRFPILDDPTELINNDSVCKSFVFGGGTFDAHIQTYMNHVIKAEGIKDLEKAFKTFKAEYKLSSNGHDTVGAVAIDKDGYIASATSTGGMPGKMIGRVGDSPLYGCGAYASDFGGCSATGHGESIIKATICRDAVYNLEQGMSSKEAANTAIDRMFKLTGGRGGLILIDRYGNISHAFSTSTMAWAAITPDGLVSGLKENEEIKEVD